MSVCHKHFKSGVSNFDCSEGQMKNF